jgi:O-antigen/teichoic acid export membrane protein
MISGKRIIKNTTLLYLRISINIILSIFITRIVLGELGEIDFGIYSLVAGVIALLSFLNGAMTVSTQRYLSTNFRKGLNQQNLIFNNSVIIHFLVGVIVLITLEIIGLFFFESMLNIPDVRLTSSKVLFHLMVVSTFFTINFVPYDSMITANEDLHVDAVLGIGQTLVRFAIAVLLCYYTGDKLIFYGIGISLTIILIGGLKILYCRKKYSTCKINFFKRKDVALFKEMMSFGGFIIFGALSIMGRNQGIAILLNRFFGPSLNASYGIANQVNSQITSFSSNLIRAINPQLMKSEGEGKRNQANLLAFYACKYGYSIVAILILPIILELKFILQIWLKNVPTYTYEITFSILIVTSINLLSIGIQSAVQAVGKIKHYQITISIILLLNLPLGIYIFKLGHPPYYIFVVTVLLELLALMARLFFANRLLNIIPLTYFKEVVLRVLWPTVLAVSLGLFIKVIIDESLFRFIVLTFFTTCTYLLFMYFIGMSISEKLMVNGKVMVFLKRIKLR